MNIKKIMLWTKIVVGALVILYVILLLAFNRDPVSVSYVFGKVSAPLWMLIVATFFIGVLTMLASGWMLRSISALKKTREVKATKTLDDEISEMNRKAAMLRTKPQSDAVAPSDTPPPT